MVTRQLQVERMTAKERWPETDVLPLSHAEQPYGFGEFLKSAQTSCMCKCVCKADKARKNAEAELSESSSHVTEINIMMQNLTNDRHRLEGDLAMMRQQLDDAVTARRSAEERAERLGIEVARLTDQLRQEQDAVASADMTRKKLETSLRELTIRLEEVESVSDGKKNIMRMQQRVRQPAAFFMLSAGA